MAKHTGWLCVSVLVLGSMAIACGDDDAGGGGGGIEFVSAGVEREPADGTASGQASRAVTALGVDLFGLLRAADGNVAVSPYSLAVALAMTRAGAAGVTAAEMDAVLHADGVENPHRAFGSLDALLAQRSGSFPVLGGDPVDLELSFGNAVWPQRGFPFEEPFLETLARSYGAGVQAVDYADDTEAARAAINGWVSDRTRSRIPELIPSGVLNTLTRVVLTNAVYLNAPWLWPFDADATTDAAFTRLDGTTVDAPLMHLSEALAYTAGDGWQAVELPYVNEQLTMVVLVPDPNRYTTVEAALSGALIDQIEASLDDRLVELRLPRWKFRSQLDLKDPLRDLGMVSAFSDTADFSAMSPEHLMITDVLQEVYVAVDEKGTEAAAATAVVVGETSAPSVEPVTLTVDRPFLFWIVDAPTKAVLFLGRVLDPTA